MSKESGALQGQLQFTERLGSDTFLHVMVERLGTVIAQTIGDANLSAGERVWLSYGPALTHLFDVSGNRISA